MPYFIDEKGKLYIAVQWDGEKESNEGLSETFETELYFFNYKERRPHKCELHGDNCKAVIRLGDYVVKAVSEDKINTYSPAELKEKFQPVSDKRVALVESFGAAMLLKLVEKQSVKDDNWCHDSFQLLLRRLQQEVEELAVEFLVPHPVNFKEAMKEAADVGNCAAMIWDKLNIMLEYERNGGCD